MHHLNRTTLLTLLTASIIGCSQEAPPPQTVTELAKPPVITPVVTETTQAESVDGSLGGSSWRLVQIMSMDDSTDVPSDRSLYTLEFGTDGTVSLRADCNRGTGSWTSESGSSLQFGPIATTRAMCPPGSLHDTYLAQFEWVRSYVRNDGHLFLATLADGAIIEFEPLDSD